MNNNQVLKLLNAQQNVSAYIDDDAYGATFGMVCVEIDIGFEHGRSTRPVRERLAEILSPDVMRCIKFFEEDDKNAVAVFDVIDETRSNLATVEGLEKFLERHDYKELGELIFSAEDYLRLLVEMGDAKEAMKVREYIVGVKEAWEKLSRRAA